jgi:hypothetical protein
VEQVIIKMVENVLFVFHLATIVQLIKFVLIVFQTTITRTINVYQLYQMDIMHQVKY